MNKFILVSLLFFSSITANAKFTLTPQGVINETNEDYIVIDCPGKSQQELFSAVQMYLSSIYVNPKEVLSIIDGKSITVTGFSKGVIYRKNLVVKTSDIGYTISFKFKDGKLRVDNPYIRSIHPTGMPEISIHVVRPSIMEEGVFTSKGKVINEKTKTSIEDFFDNYVAKVNESIINKEDTDW